MLSDRHMAIAFGIVVLLMGASAAAWDKATPHDTGFDSSYFCLTCHAVHLPVGPTLTRQPTNAALCQSCHTDGGDAADLSVPDSSKATPGVGGTSHRWDTLANQPEYGAAPPADPVFTLHIDDSDSLNRKIICSTCHNQHTNDPYRQRQRVQAVVHSQGTGPMTFGTINTVSSTATPRGFLIDFVTGGGSGTATYRLSYDSGISWLGWNGTQWGALGMGSSAFAARSPGASQNLTNTDGEMVVSFAEGSTFNGPTPTQYDSDRYKFYVGYPFYRAAPDSGDNATGSRFCRACHGAWAQTYTDARTYTGSYRSHPVGQALNANGGGYDRTTPLDVDGAAQGTTHQPNYLVLDAGGLVQCTTCHAVHYAPSNSLFDPAGRR